MYRLFCSKKTKSPDPFFAPRLSDCFSRYLPFKCLFWGNLEGCNRPEAALVIPQNIHDQSDFERQK